MNIGIVGCAGRMGRMLLKTVIENRKNGGGAVLSGGTERPGSDMIGEDLGQLAGLDKTGLAVGGDTKALFEASDVVIDFTIPAATRGHAELAAETGTALVIGTTGLDGKDNEAIDAAAERVAVVQAGNMSVGINLLCGLVEQVAEVLGPEFDIEVLEMHHRHKIDAPSGTALMLGEAAAKGRHVNLAEVAQRVRDGQTGARNAGDIGFATLRGGSVIGEHTVMFASEGERIEITHKASDRALFSTGAVRAALWCEGRAPGRYTMRDVLGL
ncbi:MAG: 4-hydroxy-tetrahydrodipicolinate reductase [Rhodospirillales bacterium]